MRQTSEILEAGMFEVIHPEKSMTIADLLKGMSITEPFGILVDGRKANPTTKIDETSKVVILPNIAGGWVNV